MPPRTCGAQGPGDILVFLPGEREIRETADLLQRSLARRPYAKPSRSSRSTRGSRCRSSSACSRRRAGGGSCSRPTSPRPRSPCRASVTSSTRASPASSATRCATRRRCCRSRRSRRRRRTSAPGAAGGSPTASACASTARTTSRRAPRYTDPEILRSSLAAVILRMAALALGDVEAFPFLEPPAPRAIADGYQLLQELGAVDGERRLTPLGREVARLPVDPRIGRMVVAARDRGCVAEVLVIASALSVPDPRDRPAREAAGGRPGAPPVPRRALRFSLAARALGVLRPEARGEAPAPQARRCLPRAVRFVPAPARMARRARAARGRSRGAGLGSGSRSCPPPSTRRRISRSTRRCSRVSSATSARWTATTRATRGRGESGSICTRGRASRRSVRNGCSPPSSSKPRGSTPAARRRSSPNGSRTSPATS